MTNFDIQYLKLLRRILNEGVLVENRTGVDTIKIPSYNFEFDLSKEFPILMSKQTFYKSAIIEMLWIWQMGSNNVKELQERGVHIWDEWMVDDDGIYRIYEPNTTLYEPEKTVEVLDPLSVPVYNPDGKMDVKYDENGKIMKAKSLIDGKNIKMAKYYGKEYAGTIGTAYGFITNRYKHIDTLIDTLKNNPNDRRMVKSLWQNEFLRTAVLPSCVWSTEWDVTSDKLNLMVHQRSCDVPLGLPFNVTQYATLLKMIAQVTDLEPGKISYSIKGAHVYVNQLKGVEEQLRRSDTYDKLLNENYADLMMLRDRLDKILSLLNNDCEEYKKFESDKKIIDIILDPLSPTLELNKDIKNFFEFDNSKDLKDVKVRNYKHMGKISFPITQ